jgi:ectoine hydroxylase-related dioxygenase (phytanoyl-CoA dioxygenase family)
MLRKLHGYNRPYDGPAPFASRCIEANGHFLLKNVFSAEEIAALRAEVEEVYRRCAPDWRNGSPTFEHAQMHRYEMYNRSALCQAAICRREILEVLDPLLGEDCHAISCTTWRNPPGAASAPRGQQWHVDGGPYIPRTEEQRWPEHLPYPIFVVTTHIYLADVGPDDGPTAILPGSHRSGRLPPHERMWDLDLDYEGFRGQSHLARAGDVTFFVSETWHRRMPPTDAGKGRFFLQTAFGRREVAQRIRPTEQLNAVSPEARARATSPRELEVLGVHPQNFYDG